MEYLKDAWEGLDLEKKYPNHAAWNSRMLARPAIAKALKQKAELQAKAGH